MIATCMHMYIHTFVRTYEQLVFVPIACNNVYMHGDA